MLVFVLAIGVVCGSASAAFALYHGESLWIAILLYSCAGSVSSLLCGVVLYCMIELLEREDAPLPKITPFSVLRRKCGRNFADCGYSTT